MATQADLTKLRQRIEALQEAYYKMEQALSFAPDLTVQGATRRDAEINQLLQREQDIRVS